MKYDYVFSGLGLAAMMALLKMAENGLLLNKSVLLLEPDEKDKNDRTWCFWEAENGKWDDLTTRKWQKALFICKEIKKDVLNGFFYKMIESEKFYNYYKKQMGVHNVKCIKEKVVSYNETADGVVVKTNEGQYSCDFLFNSVLNFDDLQRQKKYPVLKQHFLGWFIEVENDAFDENTALFMDFSVPQKGNTRFMYVLPLNQRKALVEYTLFSAELLKLQEYEEEIQNYLINSGVKNFKITAKEQGSIPMTAFPFWKKNTKRVLNIGTAGGWTKASTGFTFKNADKETDRLIELLKKKELDFGQFKKANRFTFYDDLFVDVLYRNNELGEEVFSAMFARCNPGVILKFLDEETTFLEDLKVIWSCPKLPFLKSFFRRILK
ncbi:lycopene cyclase family protein [Flavobacterium sp. H122]|uniref:lycopene cyclase family protein n=1 Tax=Flavobacterium sp. H122 TaxID=2529860 RepID=UPI0010A9A7AA|nr:lycopene cyclase family protein [Flavobacterium sp. H122]